MMGSSADRSKSSAHPDSLIPISSDYLTAVVGRDENTQICAVKIKQGGAKEIR